MQYYFNESIIIPVGDIELPGEIIVPENAKSLVLFSHGSGSSRFSPRNNFVANELHLQNIGTFLFDLLTPKEDETYSNRFNINLLTERLMQVTNHVTSLPAFANFTIGYFGASTGAASALRAAAALPTIVKAVVSRGGRPDLAIDVAPKVKAPTMLIVGELDFDVIKLNRIAYTSLSCVKKMEIIPGATHLFEEPGALYQVALLAGDWFSKYLLAGVGQRSRM